MMLCYDLISKGVNGVFYESKLRRYFMVWNLKKYLTFLTVLGGVILSSYCYGIVNPDRDDCDDNVGNVNCDYPNVVSLNGFKSDGSPYVRCTGSLIRKEDNLLVFLTAAHCSSYWQYLQETTFNDLDIGVSFDALIDRDNPDTTTNQYNRTQFLVGGVAVTNSQYLSSPGQVLSAWNIVNDYGVIVFTKGQNDKFKTYADEDLTSRLQNIDPVTLIGTENQLADELIPFESKIKHVGYGVAWKQNGAGDGGNQGGVGEDLSGFLVRSIAENSTFVNFGGKGSNWFMGSQNVNKDENGTCGGDSGGPSFTTVGSEEVQIGLVSSGSSNCALSFIDQRLDTPAAQEFLSCVLTNSDPTTCGCSAGVDASGKCTE